MKIHRLVCFSLFFTALLIAPMAFAQNLSPGEKAYVGGYRQSSVDSLTRLVLLDDNTFCFSVMAGSLDLLAAGHWKSNPQDASIALHEVRKDKPLFPALSKQVKGRGDSVEFNFDGYSLSNAPSPVFGFAATDAPPVSLRPLFSPENTSWAARYTLPPVKADKAHYFFIGYVEGDKYGRPSRVKLVQYKLSDGNTVLVGFDEIQATPLMNMSAKFIDDVLFIDGEQFGKKDSLPPEVMQDVRENCIYPVMRPDKVNAKNKCAEKQDANCAEEAESKNKNDPMLAPIKTLYMDLNAIKGVPWIDRKKLNSDSSLEQ